VRRLVAAVAVAGSLLTACSSGTPAPFRSEPAIPGSTIAAEVLITDTEFAPSDAERPRFVPCQGLSGCARTSPEVGDYYPGVIFPSAVDGQVDFSQEFVLYLVGAEFDQATLDGTTVHVRLVKKSKGFQMVKLDGQDVLAVVDPAFSFEDTNGALICGSGWEGCG
jgi:hypothetical protein